MEQQQIDSLLNKTNSISNGNLIDNLNNVNKDDLLKTLNMYAENNNNMNKQPLPKVVHKQNNNNELNEYLNDLGKKQIDQLKQVQQLQEQLQKHLQSQLLNSKNNNSNNLNYDDEGSNNIKNELISKVKILTGQLEEEKKKNISLVERLNELSNEKNDENDKKLQLIESKRSEIKTEVLNLSKKHNNIERLYSNLVDKEKFINALLTKNNNILKLEKETFFINSNKYGNMSKLDYNFNNELKNITKIELISYEFPIINNNIYEINNKLYYKIETEENAKSERESDSEEVLFDNEEDILAIPNGTYDISTLIKKLNNQTDHG